VKGDGGGSETVSNISGLSFTSPLLRRGTLCEEKKRDWVTYLEVEMEKRGKSEKRRPLLLDYNFPQTGEFREVANSSMTDSVDKSSRKVEVGEKHLTTRSGNFSTGLTFHTWGTVGDIFRPCTPLRGKKSYYRRRSCPGRGAVGGLKAARKERGGSQMKGRPYSKVEDEILAVHRTISYSCTRSKENKKNAICHKEDKTRWPNQMRSSRGKKKRVKLGARGGRLVSQGMERGNREELKAGSEKEK